MLYLVTLIGGGLFGYVFGRATAEKKKENKS
jgi:hypothetical protein